MDEVQRSVDAFWGGGSVVLIITVLFFTPVGPWLWRILAGLGQSPTGQRVATPRPVADPPEPRPALPSPAPSSTAPAWALQPADDQMSASRWLNLLNERPDDVPHVLIVAPSRSGKTTFATALLSRREGAIVVLTPKPEDRWGELPARLTIDDNGSFATIVRAFRTLMTEVQRRLIATKRGERNTTTLTIVIDDAPALISLAGKDAAEVLKLVARLGASLRMRLVLISHSTRVKSLAIGGEGDVLENFAVVQLTPASETEPRTATLTWGQTEGEPLDLKLVPRLAAQADLRARGWEPPTQRDILREDADDEAMTMPSLIGANRTRNEIPEMGEIRVAAPETDRNVLLQESPDETAIKARVLAQMVAEGKCNETDGLRIVFGVSPGTSLRYQTARAALKRAQDELRAQKE